MSVIGACQPTTNDAFFYRFLISSCKCKKSLCSTHAKMEWYANLRMFPKMNSVHKELNFTVMGLLPDTSNCGLRMRWECLEPYPRQRGLTIPTCITADSPAVSGEENVPGIPAACTTRSFTYLVRGPLLVMYNYLCDSKSGKTSHNAPR